MEIIQQENGIYIFRKDKDNFIKFSPERGGLITHWTSNNHKILYFDEKRFFDKTKSIRGGIPILFPICGDLEKKFLFGNNHLNLMQHGFARNLSWNYQLNKKKNSLSLFLSDNEETRRYYPYLFELKIDYVLNSESLIINIEIFNKSKFKMPINFGLHPYFNISDFQNIQFFGYPKNCQNQKNNTLEETNKVLKNLSKGIDILMYTQGKTSFKDFGFKRKITLIHPSPFDICVIWSDPPRKMLCMEPWTSPRNSLESGIRKINIPPNATQKLLASIKIDNL